VSERMRRARRGVRGGGARPPLRKRVMYLGGFFGTWFFADGFLFPIKELWFWTNPGHWVRVLDVAGSYMYIVL
jgi:hypothetical protein